MNFRGYFHDRNQQILDFSIKFVATVIRTSILKPRKVVMCAMRLLCYKANIGGEKTGNLNSLL